MTGTLELRKAISQWHQNEGLNIDPQQIVVGTGSKELIFLVMNIFHGGKLRCSVSNSGKKVHLSRHDHETLNNEVRNEMV